MQRVKTYSAVVVLSREIGVLAIPVRGQRMAINNVWSQATIILMASISNPSSGRTLPIGKAAGQGSAV